MHYYAIFGDLELPLTAWNHPIFDIFYRLSYLSSGWRYRLQVWQAGWSQQVLAQIGKRPWKWRGPVM